MQAMKENGYERDDLEYRKRRDDFREGNESAYDSSQKQSLAIV